jgi:hypothetical protein
MLAWSVDRMERVIVDRRDERPPLAMIVTVLWIKMESARSMVRVMMCSVSVRGKEELIKMMCVE